MNITKKQNNKKDKKVLTIIIFVWQLPVLVAPGLTCLEETNFTQGCQRKVFFQKVFGQNCKILTKYFYISRKNNKNKLTITNSFVTSKESNPF